MIFVERDDDESVTVWCDRTHQGLVVSQSWIPHLIDELRAELAEDQK